MGSSNLLILPHWNKEYSHELIPIIITSQWALQPITLCPEILTFCSHINHTHWLLLLNNILSNPRTANFCTATHLRPGICMRRHTVSFSMTFHCIDLLLAGYWSGNTSNAHRVGRVSRVRWFALCTHRMVRHCVLV